MRDNNWLLFRLEQIWDKHFSDVLQINKVYVRFGRHSDTRFGSIRLCIEDNSSHIVITSKFRDESIPEEVVDHTLAHELVHYSHGFSSPHPRLHKFPHKGGIIDKELKKRGLTNLVTYYKKWVTQYSHELWGK